MADRRYPSRPGNQKLITQGEHAVSDDKELVISTLLGSCVSVCLWDDLAGVGGMNHLLLAGKRLGNGAGYDVSGVADMEVLINEIGRLGGMRHRLKAKVFGGSKMLEHSSDIGHQNTRFAFNFLQQENIPCQSSSVGGNAARAIRFWPTTGRVNMRLAADAPEEAPNSQASSFTGNNLELF